MNMQSVSGKRTPVTAAPKRGEFQRCGASMKAVRDRIESVQKTKKITEAMKLVAAAKVRKAQDAVVQGRPFAENLIKVLYGVNQKLQGEDIDSPLARTRPVKVVTVCVVTGDRGLCGGYNSFVIKKAAARVEELQQQDPPIDVRVVSIGAKGTGFFKRRPETFNMIKEFSIGQNPTTKEAQGIADELFSEFVSEEVDKVELIYTKFQSLIKSDPVVQSLLPLLPAGEMCDIEGNCIDPAHDELFKLTTKDGKLTLEREPVDVETKPFDENIIFEQEPSEILDALLPLYLNAVILRALQEAVASELAARMNAMSNASDNADSLKKDLNTQYNRMRQATITGQIMEICGGAEAVN